MESSCKKKKQGLRLFAGSAFVGAIFGVSIKETVGQCGIFGLVGPDNIDVLDFAPTSLESDAHNSRGV
jgi:hypothetical protein